MKILPTPEIFSGQGSLKQINSILATINAKKIMVITDKGIVKAGIYDKLKNIIEAENTEIVLFDGVQPDPEINLVGKVVEIARDASVEAVIGIGGGSSLDTAKVAAALITNNNSIYDYIGIDLLKEDPVPLIAIATTAGTGSEVTPIAILSDEQEQLKKGIVSTKIIPKYAILDPELTLGIPPHVTAATGMDALVHALESYNSLNANEYSDALALKATSIISLNIRKSYNQGQDLEARNNMLVGSLMAGMAFANAGVSAVHAFAYPLGGMFHIPHGLANSVMLLPIMEYNMVGNEKRFAQMAKALLNDRNADEKSLISGIEKLCVDLKIPANLADLKIPQNAIEQMAQGAMKVTRLLANNPRKIELEDAVELYTKAYNRQYSEIMA